MGEWKRVRIGDVCRVINGRAYSLPELLDEGKYRILRVGNFFTSDRWYYSDMELEPDKYCERGDLLFAWSASFGPRIWDGEKVIYHYHIWKMMPDESLVDKRWLYYWLLRSCSSLTTGVHGSVMAHMTKSEMELAELQLPDLPTQRRIAAVLGALDDKIEVNRKICENLEAQAQALFKAWFVDFEPFGGKRPEGWKMGRLGDVAAITMGQSPDGASLNENDDGVTFYQGRAEFGRRFPTKRLSTAEPKRMARRDDVLLSVRAPVGDLNIAIEDCCIGRGLAALREKKGRQSYLYYLLKTLKPSFDLYEGAGTIFGSINKDSLCGLEVLVPDEEHLQAFHDNVSAMDSMIQERECESRALAAMRDALLPKLMSGELAVEKVERL